MSDEHDDLDEFDLWRDSGLARGAAYVAIAVVLFSLILTLLGTLLGTPELAMAGG